MPIAAVPAAACFIEISGRRNRPCQLLHRVLPQLAGVPSGARQRREKGAMERRFSPNTGVLDASGRPTPGWGERGELRYLRSAIRAPAWRVKEWDWYQVSDGRYAVQFTYGHASYAGQVGVMFFDFASRRHLFTRDIILPLPFSSMHLPASAEEDSTLLYEKDDFLLRIEKRGRRRSIECRCEGFSASLAMEEGSAGSVAVNIPFRESPHAFYYNQKIGCMPAEGAVQAAGVQHCFGEDAFGLLDWGRGVWPFHNAWYWANAAGRLGGEVFGLNLGMGFGDTSAASENAIFYGGALHKLGPVQFTLGAGYNDDWHFTDLDGRLRLVMHPLYDRKTAIRLLWVNNSCHQMFGRFSGSVTLDDGSRLEVKDITGFAEHAINNW